MCSEVHILAGNIGTGKSTTTDLIRSKMVPGTYYVISNDSLIMTLTMGYHGPNLYKVPWKSETEKFKLGLVQFAIKYDLNIIIDECNITHASRAKVINAAREAGECMIYVHWHEFKDGLNRRIESDSRNQNSETWKMVHEMFDKASEFPESQEGWDSMKIWDGLGNLVREIDHSGRIL